MSEDTSDAPLHDPRWREGETVTLRPGNRTWAMNQRANTAMQREALAGSGISTEEVKRILDTDGEDALGELLTPHVDPVVQQLSIMRSMILSWTLPWPLTPEGLEELPEEYGEVIWAAIEARRPAPVPRTAVGDFRQPGGGDPGEPLSVVRDAAGADEGAGGVGHQTDGVDTPGTRRGRR